MVNYAGCSECKTIAPLKSTPVATEDEDDDDDDAEKEEIIKFTRLLLSLSRDDDIQSALIALQTTASAATESRRTHTHTQRATSSRYRSIDLLVVRCFSHTADDVIGVHDGMHAVRARR